MKNALKHFVFVMIFVSFVGCSINLDNEPIHTTTYSPKITESIEAKTNGYTLDPKIEKNYDNKVMFQIYQDYENKIILELLVNNNISIEAKEVIIDKKRYLMEDNAIVIDEELLNKFINTLEIKLCYSYGNEESILYKNVLIQDIRGMDKLFFDIENSCDVQNLWIINSEYLTDISALSDIYDLKAVFFNNCIALSDLSCLWEQKKLESLCFLRVVPNDLTGLSTLTSLKSLVLMEFGEEKIDTNELMKLSELEYLNLYNFSNKTIDNINNLLYLKELYISNSNINSEQVNLISKLTELKSLSITACNQISDVSELKNLKNLLYLNISNCKQIYDLSELKSLTNLRIIILRKLELVDNIDFISYATNLLSLNISNLKNVKDVKLLEANNKIVECSLDSNNFDIAPLMKNNNLKYLEIVDAVNIDSLKYSKGLWRLDIKASYGFNNSEELDVTSIGKLSYLEELYISGYNVKNIEPLRNVLKLKTLVLEGKEHQEIDATPLSSLTKLEYLDINEHDNDGFIISDLSFLESLLNLKCLKLNLSGISDYTPIISLYNLETLILSNASEDIPDEIESLNKLRNLEFRNCVFKGQETALLAVGKLKKLENLHINECYSYSSDGYLNLSFIENLSNLNELFVDCLAANVIKFPELHMLDKLRKLHVSEFRGNDISGIWGATNLEVLKINDSVIGDISNIQNFIELKEIWFRNNEINDYSPILVLQNIRRITITPLYNENYDFSEFYNMNDVKIIVN